MTDTPTIASSRGTPQPNPRYFGFKGGTWRELQKLLDEGEKLRGEAKKAYRERLEADEEIKRLEGELREQRAAALRGGPEPDETRLEKAKSRREALNERMRDYKRAGEMIDAEIHQLVAVHREEWDAEVRAMGEQVLAEAREVAETLSRKLSETDSLVGVHAWLTSGGVNYTPARARLIGGGRMSEDLGHLTDEDLERIGAIVEGSVSRAHGQHILAAVEASAKASGKPHPLVEAIARAYQERGEQE